MKECLNQNVEVTTVKQRNISISLSDEDLKKLVNKAGSVGFTVGELLQSFICDLVNGTDSYDSSCRSFIEDWYNYSFSDCDETLLSNLMCNGDIGFDNVDSFVDIVIIKECLTRIIKAKKVINPFIFYKEESITDDELAHYQKQLLDFNGCYDSIIYDYLTYYPNADLLNEVDRCKEFVKQYYILMGVI